MTVSVTGRVTVPQTAGEDTVAAVSGTVLRPILGTGVVAVPRPNGSNGADGVTRTVNYYGSACGVATVEST